MSLSPSCTVIRLAFSGLDIPPPQPPTAALEPQLPLTYPFPFPWALLKSVLSEAAAWLKNKTPDAFFFLKNTIGQRL